MENKINLSSLFIHTKSQGKGDKKQGLNTSTDKECVREKRDRGEVQARRRGRGC